MNEQLVKILALIEADRKRTKEVEDDFQVFWMVRIQPAIDKYRSLPVTNEQIETIYSVRTIAELAWRCAATKYGRLYP